MAENNLDLAGWWHTTWGMTADDLEFELRDMHLKKVERIDYGQNYVDFVVEGAEIGNVQFNVLFQMDKQSNRLRKVLMRHELPLGAPQDRELKSVFNVLIKDFGAPEMQDKPNEFKWAFPSTLIHLYPINLPNSLNLICVIFDPAPK